MNKEQQKLKSIYIGYHPRTHDGSSPLTRTLSDSTEIMDAFNKKQEQGRFRAEVIPVEYSDLCAVAVMETTINKVWQYI